MDTFVVNKLEDWGLSELIEDFQAEDINEESFKLIQYENLKEIIKKAGPRILFWSKFQKEFSPITSIATTEGSYSNQTAQSAPSENFLGPSTSAQALNSISDNLNDTFFTTLLEVPPITLPQPCVTEYLKTFNGSVVKKFYEENGFLDNTHKSMLTNLIISSELDKKQSSYKNIKISSERFQELTQQIIAIFPTECAEQYYSPYNSTTKICTSGKLYETFNYYKKKFKKALNTSKAETSAIIATDKTIEDKLQFLKTNIEPWETVKLFWNECRSYRLKRQFDFTIQDYFEKFKCLTLAKGIELLLSDFDARYPDKINNLFCCWEEINKKLVTICRSKQKPELNNLLEIHEGPLTGFALLPFLLSSSVYKTIQEKPEIKRKKRYKLTSTEVQESFFMFINDDYLVEEHINNITNKKFKEKKSIQPYLLFVGQNFGKISKAYVIINSVRYEFSSGLIAIDAAFKVFQVLDARYPTDCEPVWQFIQKQIYEISTKFDKNFHSVLELIQQVKAK